LGILEIAVRFFLRFYRGGNMNFKKFLVFGFVGFLGMTSCAALQEMEGDVSGRHYAMKSFSLPPGSTDSVTFNVNAQGSISATLSTRGLASSESGATDSMLMALYSPSDVALVQNEGNPHERLKLRYRVPRSSQEGVWKVILTNRSERTISGTLKVYYPYEDTAGRTTSGGTSGTTAQQDTWGSPQGGSQSGGASQPYPESYPPPTSQGSQSGGYESSGGYGNEPPPPSSSSGGYGTESAPQSPSQAQAPSQSSEPQQPSQTSQPTPESSSQKRKIFVVNPKVLQVATAKPVKYGVMLNTFDLTLGRDERDKFYFHVRREGTIDVYVRWERNNTNRNVKLAVILNGPAQNNALARKDGLGHVHLQYHVKKSDIVAGKMWKVSIARFDDVHVSASMARNIAQFKPITGNIQVRYPKE